MKKRINSLLALCLALVMVVGLLPIQAHAADDGGNFGTNNSLSWEFNEASKTLTIKNVSGDGKTPSYAELTGQPWQAYKDSIENLIVGNGITEIGSRLFAQLTNLKSLEFSDPGSLELIHNLAFAYCTSLDNVTIPANVRLVEYAFSSCTGMTRLTIEDGVTVASGSNSPFKGCTGLEYVRIPATLQEYGLFKGCTKLQSVEFGTDTITIPSAVFSGCESLTNFAIPEGVTSIGSEAFYGCKNLVSVTVPKSVTSIGATAFQACTSLESVSLTEGVTTIDDHAFSQCSALKSLIIPKTVSSIGAQAFASTGLKKVVFLGDVSGITLGQGVFGATGTTNAPVTIYYPYDSGLSYETVGGYAWGGQTGTWSAKNAWVDVSDITFTNVEGIIDSQAGTTTFTLTSNNVPFDADGGKIITNYELEGKAFPENTTVELSGNNMTATIVVPEIISTTARAATSVNVLGDALEATVFNAANNYQVVNSFSETANVTERNAVGSLEIINNVTDNSGNLGSKVYTFYVTGPNGYNETVTMTGSNNHIIQDLPVGQYTVTLDTASAEAAGCVMEVNANSTTVNVTADAIGNASFTITYNVQAAITVDVTATAAWVNDNETVRPDGFRVQLYLNGTASGNPVTLNAANSWSYTWSNRDASTGNTWTVEAVDSPANYTVSVSNTGMDYTITNTYTPPTRYLQISYKYADGTQAADPYSGPVIVGNTYSVTSPTISGYTPDKAVVSGTMPDRDMTIEVTYNVASTPTGGGGGGGSRTPSTPVTEQPFPEVVPPPKEGDSPWQDMVVEEKTPIPWIERIDPPAYAKDLYDVLVAGSDPSAPYGPSFTDLLVQDASFELDKDAPGGDGSGIVAEEAEVITFTLLDPYANVSLEGLDSMIFANDDYFSVDVSDSDQRVNYASLKLGDVVKTPNYNGVYVTKISKGTNFDQEKKDVAACIATVFQAFDRDHPEVFWLTGQCRIRTVSTTASDGSKNAYFFLTLADKDGFSMKADAWKNSGAVANGLQRRDAAVNKVLAAVTAKTPYEQVRQLNRWLTEHNEYNTTADLTTIGNEPHECLSALEGRIGTNGPVCDGYARAFKVLCNKLGISCILENGYAKPTAKSAGTFHMWNSVQVGTGWYGMDVTWNDPMVKGASGAKSGKENENYLLVGSATEVRGMTFSASHPVTNQAITAGVAFTNKPALSPVAYSSVSADSEPVNPAKPFTDVANGAWYEDAVYDVYQRTLMTGTSATTFSPGANLTRQQIWMMLSRLNGQRPAGMTAAKAWAMDSSITDGTNPGANVSRQQLVTLLYRTAQSRNLEVSANEDALKGITDASKAASYAQDPLRWAVANGILTSSNGLLSPEAPATRAQAAASFSRFCEIYKL